MSVLPAWQSSSQLEEKHSPRTEITDKSVAQVNTLEAHTYVNVAYI